MIEAIISAGLIDVPWPDKIINNIDININIIIILILIIIIGVLLEQQYQQ